MATRPLGVEVPGVAMALRRPGAWTVLARFCRKKPLGAIGGFLMLVILFTAVFANQLQTHDPIATDAARAWRGRGPITGSAPTISVATSTPASCTGRGSR